MAILTSLLGSNLLILHPSIPKLVSLYSFFCNNPSDCLLPLVYNSSDFFLISSVNTDSSNKPIIDSFIIVLLIEFLILLITPLSFSKVSFIVDTLASDNFNLEFSISFLPLIVLPIFSLFFIKSLYSLLYGSTAT